MKVRIKRGQLNYFRSLARGTENEIAAYLTGSVDASDRVTVKQIVIAGPEDCAEQTPNNVDLSMEFFEKVRAKAESKGTAIVGQIHSHPNWWPVKSGMDHKTQLSESWRILGVCAVMKPKTKVYFWVPESSLPATIEYY